MTPNEIVDALEDYRNSGATYADNALLDWIDEAIAHLRAPAALPELPPSDEWRAQFIDALTDYRHASLRDIPIASKRVHELVRAYALAALAGRGQDAADAIQINLTEEQAQAMHEYIGEGEEYERPITLFIGKGHSGYGLYIADTEYLEEGAAFIAAIAASAGKEKA